MNFSNNNKNNYIRNSIKLITNSNISCLILLIVIQST
jgi:hypothetical protein